MSLNRICLIGSTGAIGTHILGALLQLFPSSAITLLTREGSSLPPSLPSDVTITRVPSYTDRATVLPALRGHDVLISALSTPALDIEPTLVDIAIEASVRRFFPSEFTMDVLDPVYKNLAKTPIAARRVQWAEKLKEIAEGGKIEYTTIVPGPFVDYCIETKFWPFDIYEKKATLYDGGDVKRTGCSLAFAGTCVAAALKMPEQETRNKRIRISEVEYTAKSLVEALQQATGTQWTVEEKPSTDLLKKEEDEMDNGREDQAYFAFVVRGNFDSNPAGYFEDGLSFRKEGDIVVPRRTLSTIMKNVVESEGT